MDAKNPNLPSDQFQTLRKAGFSENCLLDEKALKLENGTVPSSTFVIAAHPYVVDVGLGLHRELVGIQLAEEFLADSHTFYGKIE